MRISFTRQEQNIYSVCLQISGFEINRALHLAVTYIHLVSFFLPLLRSFLLQQSFIRYRDGARCDTSQSARKYIPRFCLDKSVRDLTSLHHSRIGARHSDRFNLYCRRRMIKVVASNVTKVDSSSISTAESARCAHQ